MRNPQGLNTWTFRFSNCNISTNDCPISIMFGVFFPIQRERSINQHVFPFELYKTRCILYGSAFHRSSPATLKARLCGNRHFPSPKCLPAEACSACLRNRTRLLKRLTGFVAENMGLPFSEQCVIIITNEKSILMCE